MYVWSTLPISACCSRRLSHLPFFPVRDGVWSFLFSRFHSTPDSLAFLDWTTVILTHFWCGIDDFDLRVFRSGLHFPMRGLISVCFISPPLWLFVHSQFDNVTVRPRNTWSAPPGVSANEIGWKIPTWTVLRTTHVYETAAVVMASWDRTNSFIHLSVCVFANFPRSFHLHWCWISTCPAGHGHHP